MIVAVEGTDFRYHLLSYDAEGRERGDGGEPGSDVAVRGVHDDGITDVLLVSHGWQGDVPAAKRQYQRWFSAMLGCEGDRARLGDFRPLVIGLHWPSRAWGDEDLPSVSFDAKAVEAPQPTLVNGLIDEYAALLDDTDAARAALQVIMDAALDDPEPDALPPVVTTAYAHLQTASGLHSAGFDAPSGAEGEAVDAQEVYQAALDDADFADFGLPGVSSILAPLRTLTFWKMKQRARYFGEGVVHPLLARLSAAAPDGGRIRIHLIGHSFGCIVVTSAVCGPPDDTHPLLVDSLTLVQGAMSVWSFASGVPRGWTLPGYFRRLVDRSLVRGSIVTTQSRHDRAVGFFYPLGAGAAGQVDFASEAARTYGSVGTFGIQGPGLSVTNLDINPIDAAYDFAAGRIYNVESSEIIKNGRGFSGAHNDISHPEVAHLVWEAIRSGLT